MLVDEFAGKVAFITGAGNGIGRETAIAFARAGAVLAIVDIDADGSEMTAREVRALGRKALVLPCDLTKEAEVKAALDATVKAFGGLDIAFNTPGSTRRACRLPTWPKKSGTG